MMEVLSKYARAFSHLRVARVKGELAPHKPILLLSVINGIEKGEIPENKIHITPELVADFKSYWSMLGISSTFSPNFSLPFYHLKSDGFWYLKTIIGKEIILTSSHSIKSFAQLKDVVDYALFGEDLYSLLLNKSTREILRHTLLATYFPPSNVDYASGNNKIVSSVVNQILNESSASYKLKAKSFDEEEVFIRNGFFKKVIPQAYNLTCCVSEMRVIANRDIQMIDACHIIPFSESHDDTISNGISLCPNLHRAFDRGLISIDENYSVVVSNDFDESSTNCSFKIYSGKRILLPKEEKYFPSLENFRWHRNNVFKSSVSR